MSVSSKLVVVFLICCGCSIVPDVPDDYSLPLREILTHTTCELRRAFIDLNQPKYSSFKASQWLIAVSLAPKTDQELTAGVGYTGKSTNNTKNLTFTNWALGSLSLPGAQIDIKGTRNASAYYNIHSSNLINAQKFPLSCDTSGPVYHQLVQNLGIHDWLIRAESSKDQSVGALAQIDKPSYSSEIYIKASGNGNFTYNFPWGTNFGSISPDYDLDETLNIALTADTSTVIKVQTLPIGGNFKTGPDVVVMPSIVNPQARLDLVQSQQEIINALKNLPQQ